MIEISGFLCVVLISSMLCNGAPGASFPGTIGEGGGIHSAVFQNELLPAKSYTLQGMGRGAAQDGTDLTVKIYLTSDGIDLTIAHGQFKSPVCASAEWDHDLRQAEKVLRRASRTNAAGTVFGNSAVVRVAAKESIPGHFAVLLTNNSDYYSIRSSSLDVALDVAKRFYEFHE